MFGYMIKIIGLLIYHMSVKLYIEPLPIWFVIIIIVIILNNIHPDVYEQSNNHETRLLQRMVFRWWIKFQTFKFKK